MDIKRIDRLTTILRDGASRRRLVRMLAGGAAGGLTAAAGLTTAGAKKKKRKKKPKTVTETCPAGTLVASVIVPATGRTVSTPPLENGQRYKLRAVGTWSTNASYGHDAYAAFTYADPNTIEKTFDGVRLGLSVDEESPDEWEAYNLNHIYARQVTGKGVALTLEINDPATNDNAGSLVVDVFCD